MRKRVGDDAAHCLLFIHSFIRSFNYSAVFVGAAFIHARQVSSLKFWHLNLNLNPRTAFELPIVARISMQISAPGECYCVRG